jgi:tRNA (guanine37-N1)-methyltransferase
MTLCIRVPKEDGEDVRNRLISSGLLNRNARIRTDEGHVLIPILSDSFEGHEVIDAELEPIIRKESDYRNIVDVPEELRGLLPNSYDVIGDIAVIKFQDEMLPYANIIGNALLESVPSLRAVMSDRGVKGEFRVRGVDIIAGTGTSETMHKEFGVTMLVDPGKVYFNPRLSTERMRIALMVKEGETIIDMFAGIAPFPLIIAKHARPKAVYAVDLNEDALEFMRRNIRMNKVTNVIPICADAGAVLKELPPADRIIMNLPQTADSFLPAALSNLKKGGTAHLHKIMDRESSEETIASMIDSMKEKGFSIRIDNTAELKTYSPSMSVYVLDVVKE